MYPVSSRGLICLLVFSHKAISIKLETGDSVSLYISALVLFHYIRIKTQNGQKMTQCNVVQW